MEALFGIEPSFCARTRAASPVVPGPAPAQKPATATTVDAVNIEPQLTAKKVLEQCDIVFKRGDCRTLLFPPFPSFSTSVYDEIRECWARSNSPLKLRITSTEKFPIILELMLSGSHEKASGGLAALIQEVFGRKLSPNSFANEYFIFSGATRLKLNSPFKSEKEADASFAPVGSDQEPSVIIEVGRSETITELRGDMKRWFTLQSVRLVILIEISKPTPAHPELPTLRVEMWMRSIPDDSKRDLNEDVCAQVSSDDWSRGVGRSLEIPLDMLLGKEEIPDGLPRQLELPVKALGKLRQHIIDAWIKEHKNEIVQQS